MAKVKTATQSLLSLIGAVLAALVLFGSIESAFACRLDQRTKRILCDGPDDSQLLPFRLDSLKSVIPMGGRFAQFGLPLQATRLFVAPHNYPPRNFAAYGIVAFPTLSTPQTRTRHVRVCQAYWSALIESEDSALAPESQMVTVWPVDTENLAADLHDGDGMTEGCEKAVDHYHLATSQMAINQAGAATDLKFSRRGPFLLAWSPSSSKGLSRVPILVLDLSDANTEELLKARFEQWRDRIQRNRELWAQPEGWSLERVKELFREFVDTTGNEILRFATGQSSG